MEYCWMETIWLFLPPMHREQHHHFAWQILQINRSMELPVTFKNWPDPEHSEWMHDIVSIPQWMNATKVILLPVEKDISLMHYL